MSKIISIIAKNEQNIYSNDNNFHINRFKLIDQKEFDTNLDTTFFGKGVFKELVLDQEYELSGEIVNDPKYGLQLNISNAQVHILKNKKSIINFLSSNIFVGIGSVTAEKIIDIIGFDCVELIENDEKIVDQQLGFLNDEQKQSLIDGIKSNANLNALFSFFDNYFTNEFINKINIDYGTKALERYKQNPYIMYYDYQRTNINNLDRFAIEKLNYGLNDVNRIKCHIYASLKNISGHTKIAKSIVLNTLRRNKIDTTNFELIEQCFSELEEENIVKILDENNIAYKLNFDFEKNIAARIKDLNKFEVPSFSVLDAIKELEISQNFEYNEQQCKAIENSFYNNVSIISGGPGTGKTTIINAIVKIFKKNVSENIGLIAPTGKAATRMSEVTKIDAKTIHSYLGYALSNEKPNLNTFNQSCDDLIILDESSMVDVEMFSLLLDAISEKTKFIIVGDINQLSSVGPGSVLDDLIASRSVKTTMLNIIKRQSENSSIITLASDILNQKLNKEFFKKRTHDFKYYQIQDKQSLNALDTILKDEFNNFKKEQIQILTPRRNVTKHQILSTVTSINKHVQPIFNDNKTLVYNSGFLKLFVDDRIINNENNREKKISNGDQGYIKNVVYRNKKVTNVAIDFDKLVDFSVDELKSIDLSYATTVHKSQGSEYDLVIVVLLPEHGHIVSKKLIYTAVTRAKKKLIILGNYDYINQAIQNEQIEIRETNLVKLLGEEYGR